MNDFMEEVAQRHSHQLAVRSFFVQTMSLDDIPFPPELLQSSSARVGIAVAVNRPPGEPWGSYVVVSVALEDQEA